MALKEDYLVDLSYSNKVVEMYEKLNVDLTSDIIKKLKETGDISSYTKSQLRQLIKRGGKEVFLSSLEKTSNLSSKRKTELRNLFIQLTKDDIESFKKLYDYRGKEMEVSESQYKLLNKQLKMTNKEFQNFTKSIAFSNQQDFVNAVDTMYQQVVTGGTDFNTAFRQTTNELAQKGTTLPMSDGRNRSIEAAVRQNIRTSVRNTARLINQSIGKELDCDGVQINISPNCRPSHEVINGKVFKVKSATWQRNKYLLEDYNCQHYETPIIFDIEGNIYTKEEIYRANHATVEYNGKTLPYYEATQMQRALERNIRNAKKQYVTLKNSGLDTTEAKKNVSNAQKLIRDFINETGLERDPIRERYAGYN